MREKHLEIEKAFYDEAYRDPATRLQRGYGWDVKPSPSMVELYKEHIRPTIEHPEKTRVLDIGIGADARNARYFLEEGFRLMGIDISENAIRHCKKNLPYSYLWRTSLSQVDMSVPHAIHRMIHYMFGIIIDWSVMDHIRREYLPAYKASILECLNPGGFLISSQFADPMPEKFKPYKGRDYCLWNGHYMRCFTIEGLIAEFPTLKVVDYWLHCEEDQVNGIKIHTVLFQKEN